MLAAHAAGRRGFRGGPIPEPDFPLWDPGARHGRRCPECFPFVPSHSARDPPNPEDIRDREQADDRGGKPNASLQLSLQPRRTQHQDLEAYVIRRADEKLQSLPPVPRFPI